MDISSGSDSNLSQKREVTILAQKLFVLGEPLNPITSHLFCLLHLHAPQRWKKSSYNLLEYMVFRKITVI